MRSLFHDKFFGFCKYSTIRNQAVLKHYVMTYQKLYVTHPLRMIQYKGRLSLSVNLDVERSVIMLDNFVHIMTTAAVVVSSHYLRIGYAIATIRKNRRL